MGETVTIASKLPHGLHLRVFDMIESTVPAMGGGVHKVPRPQQRGSRVTIKGTARQNAEPFLAGGYALTHDVDAKFWQEWVVANAEAEVVKKKLVFAHAKPIEAAAIAKDHATLNSGFEQLNPTAIPKEFRVGDAKIETATKDDAR